MRQQVQDAEGPGVHSPHSFSSSSPHTHPYSCCVCVSFAVKSSGAAAVRPARQPLRERPPRARKTRRRCGRIRRLEALVSDGVQSLSPPLPLNYDRQYDRTYNQLLLLAVSRLAVDWTNLHEPANSPQSLWLCCSDVACCPELSAL